MLRTQIYLPEELRREIDRSRGESGESLGDYLRGAAKQRLEQERKKKIDLKKLAMEVIGSSNRSEAEVQEWLDWIQAEKRLVDQKIDEKWAKAHKK